MAGMAFKVASGRDDFEAVASLWSRRYGYSPSAQTRLVSLMRTGSLVVTRDRDSNQILGAVPLDFQSFDNTLLVPFNLVAEEDGGRVLRRQLRLILQAALSSEVERILFYADEREDYRQAIAEFNARLAEQQLPMRLEILGTVENYFGDDRDVAVSSFFIRRAERPELIRKVPAAANAIMRTAYDVSRFHLPQVLVASKCSKEKESDKEPGKGEKGEKDGKELDLFFESSGSGGLGDAFYRSLGVDVADASSDDV